MAGTITHQWNGTVLTITSDSGTSSSDLKGAKGDDGARGAQGAPGSSVAEDSQKLGGVAAAQYALKNNVPAHNLLDNSDFSNYINQRGEISTAGVWNYCIDRWRAIGTAGQLVWHNSDHIALGALRGISQAIENKSRFVWKTYTLAAKDIDGVLYITSGTYGGDDSHIWKETNGMELRLYSVSDDNNIYFSLKNLSSDTSKFIYLKWAALYEGSYDASTLPAYQPKEYAAELAECQRYYREVYRVFGKDVGNVTREAIILNPQMRIPPTATVKSLWKGNDDTSVTVNSTANNNADVTYTGWGSTTIAFSADL